MDPIRPRVDAYVLHWLLHHPLRRDWLFEQRSGPCRLMPAIIEQSETASTWARAVAPIADAVAKALWSTTTTATRGTGPATSLSQNHRRSAKGAAPQAPTAPRRPPSVCLGCGAALQPGSVHCAACAAPASSARMVEIAKQGRVVAQAPKAQARRAATRRRHTRAARAWNPSDQPPRLTEEVYVEQIQQRLASLTIPALASARAVSLPYAAQIRTGRRRPHPRHWRTLAAARVELSHYFAVADGNRPRPGGLHAVRLDTGKAVWTAMPGPALCGQVRGCSVARPAAVTAIPGLVFSGSLDGGFRAYSTKDGHVVWEYDTNREFETVNGIKANGASINSGGPVISGGMVYTNSGYGFAGGRPGNVLLAFGVD